MKNNKNYLTEYNEAISLCKRLFLIMQKQDEELKTLKEELTLYKASVDEANRLFEEKYSKSIKEDKK